MNNNEVTPKDKGEYNLIKLALTISPPKRLDIEVKDLLNRYLSLLSRINSRFELYPELDNAGRLHFHGFIWKNSLSYPQDLNYMSAIGFIKIKEIFDNKKWLKYCKKEWRTMKKLLHRAKPYTNADCLHYNKSYDLERYGIHINNSDKNTNEWIF